MRFISFVSFPFLQDIVSKFSSEYQDGLKKPLEDVARVTAETAREAELARNKTEFAKRAAARLRDSVQRREVRKKEQAKNSTESCFPPFLGSFASAVA